MKDPFSKEELQELAKKVSVQELLNKRGKVYKERKEELEKLSDSELIEAMAAEPKLIRRPILIKGDEVVVGFKEKEMEKLFQS